MSKTIVACLQMNSGEEVTRNIADAEKLIRQAAKQGASLVALPENAFFMRGNTIMQPADYDMTNHPALPPMQALARELGVTLLLGSIFVKPAGAEKWLNRSVLIDAAGNITAQYDKIHLFDVAFDDGEIYRESATFDAGAQAVLADTDAGKLGMSICYDLRFAHLYRSLAKAGAEIISVPAAFARRTGQAHWHVLLRARAIETGCYVIAPAQCGEHPGGRQTFGHALMVNPWGEVIAEATDGVGIIFAEIDREQVAATRRQLPSLQHDREYRF